MVKVLTDIYDKGYYVKVAYTPMTVQEKNMKQFSVAIPSLTVEAIKKPAKGWNLNP